MRPFSELGGKEKLIEALRWICVPVAAVLVVLALRIVGRIAMPIPRAQLPGTPVTAPSDFQRLFLPWILSILMGLAFVLAGAKAAPRRRFATAVVLAVLWMLYSFSCHVLVHLDGGIPHYAHFAHFAVAAAAAAGGAAYIFYSEKRRSAVNSGIERTG